MLEEPFEHCHHFMADVIIQYIGRLLDKANNKIKKKSAFSLPDCFISNVA
jgi:hypothetical protein